MDNARTWTRREIESLIAAGDTIVINQNTVLRLNAWKEKHPGGDLVIRHMVGRNAVDEINISHSSEALQGMQRYRIGRIEGHWQNFIPPIQGGVFRDCHDDKEEDDQATTLSNAKDDPASCSKVDKLDGEDTRASPEETASYVQRDIDTDLLKYPSLDAATQRDIAAKFQALHERVRHEGFYHCRFLEYGKEMLRYAALFALFAFCLSRSDYFVSACFLGLFWHQIMFSAHDAGHRGITQNFTTDTLIGIFIADVCCGLSIGWWKSSHNVHHLVPNHPVSTFHSVADSVIVAPQYFAYIRAQEHDPDIQNVPLFATSPSFFNSIKSSYYGITYPWDAFASFAINYQKYTYYPVMAVARFNLYFLSWAHLISPRSYTKGSTWWTRPTEVAGIAIYTFLYFYILLYRCIPTWQSRAVFLLTSHLITMPLHVQITLSHWATSTSDLGPAESFAQRQLRTTMDVECPKWLDFLHGGLQFQAEHHLFPRVPRHNLRRLRDLVRDFCRETDIEYLIYGFAHGNSKVLGKLQEVTDQARMLAACQAHMAVTGESGLH